MGNDGGSIPKRSEILNFSQKKLHGGGKTRQAGEFNNEICISKTQNAYKYCHLSNKPLRKPIVSDAMGNLYNKEDILQFLLDKKRSDGPANDAADDIKIESLNDVVQLNIDLNEEKGILKCLISDIQVDINNSTETALNNVLFSYIVPCGCTMNTKVLRNLVGWKGELDEEKKCPNCSEIFSMIDVIDLCSLDSKVCKRLESRIDKLKTDGKYHNLKKIKSKKNKGKKRNVEESPLESVKKTKI